MAVSVSVNFCELSSVKNTVDLCVDVHVCQDCRSLTFKQLCLVYRAYMGEGTDVCVLSLSLFARVVIQRL